MGAARTWWSVVATPVDDLLLLARDHSLMGVRFEPFTPAGERADDHPVLAEAAAQLRDYFAGRRTRFDLALAPEGTPFQRRVWDALLTVGYGETVSYGDIARRIGADPATSSRAVGLANGRNPIPVVIPCHRVVGKDGSLTGFGGGLARKRLLLDLESQRLF